MKKHWNEIQPVDHYQVKLNGLLHDTDRKILTFLYQPLIGAKCFSLYMTLWAEVEDSRLWSRESSHYHLMNFLDMNLQTIYEERLKLEGMGLLKTYLKTNGETREFIYELQPPLTPDQFFNDGMLNIFLYRKIGRTHFLRLKEFFSDTSIDHQEFREVTKEFPDVFTAGNLSMMDGEAMEASAVQNGGEYLSRTEKKGLPLSEEDFDFSLLESGLKQSLIPKQALTPTVRETIVKLSFLYGINAIEMKNIILSAMDEQDRINLEVLRKSARDWYQIEKNEQLPELINRTQPVIQRSIAKTPQTQEEKLIAYLENTSPKQLLVDISGSLPSAADLKIIENVMLQHKLPAGVVNVLIQYVMIKTDMKLTEGYVEKIASHWARKQLKTVPEAMELAKKEHQKYSQWAQSKKTTSKRKVVRTEKLPDWFESPSNGKQGEEKVEDDFDFEAEKRKLEAELKKGMKDSQEVKEDETN